ncbi:3-hydroxyacyl-ACP dehydratase FabZ [Brevibacillus laterosporus]|uniref:3-hydroxyacyl-[acyl-carrier-protein] dehydratase FabZ n=1 Tax=Brevibacillus laterosporus LMG 15441 TaxID=1042163 RepID=A0A075R253_BRELA|nr:3-hydroxyacyl-ACP dehydratase FabZ [Brevibacillus laterosporus]AIG26662.1 3-hydroxyacyl-[acyl-carrier-protein] dehydratase FabZ [Brevibacillus laterosporus LMG 15441]RJL14101.1 3-hydroxyacyl-[acyl-carrier-protein] dehydratase FabZ [Brevibacillus laterosporus]
MVDTQQIMDVIRHRYPFLLVDKIVELEKGRRAVGIKNVTANEEFFTGYFPNDPIMPGVLIIEALAQVGAIVMLTKAENKGRLGLLAGIDHCCFKHQVKPGDQIRLEVEITRLKGAIGKGKGIATVDGELACEAEIIFAFGD